MVLWKIRNKSFPRGLTITKRNFKLDNGDLSSIIYFPSKAGGNAIIELKVAVLSVMKHTCLIIIIPGLASPKSQALGLSLFLTHSIEKFIASASAAAMSIVPSGLQKRAAFFQGPPTNWPDPLYRSCRPAPHDFNFSEILPS